MSRSRLSGFYKLPLAERQRVLGERGLVGPQDQAALAAGRLLPPAVADGMIENVVGVFGLPLGLGLNFLVNGREYVAPLVVEEASIVAGLSSAARLAFAAGGFSVEADESLLIGQVHVVDVPRVEGARAALLERKAEVLALADSLHPKMVERGGGARDLELPAGPAADGVLTLHLLVDTRDAMGANLVNTMCEGVAPLVEAITGGRVFMRILSNLADRSLVRARVALPASSLAGDGVSGERVRDGVILANDIARADPYRAVTHNKGIMNGVDAVAIATGNDWRAIEASAHAYAARGGRYSALTRWSKRDDGALLGELELPLKVGVVSGAQLANPGVGVCLRLCGAESARELAALMAAVGLAQNFAALRALVTDGIQRGHMRLHARSLALAAGASPEDFERVVAELVASGDVKDWKAREIVARSSRPGATRGVVAAPPARGAVGVGHGKVILFGEHAVVYGSHAVALPLPLAVSAEAREVEGPGVRLLVPDWGVDLRLDDGEPQGVLQRSLALVLTELGLRDRRLQLEVSAEVPRAMGLGSSAALAVAIIRALSLRFELRLADDHVNRLAFRCERLAHGTPSGIDNTLATFGRPLLYRRGEPPTLQPLQLTRPLSLVIGHCRSEGFTSATVAKVRAGYERQRGAHERIFADIDALALQGAAALEGGRLEELGELMDLNHGLLNAIGVSTLELEELVALARQHGALGAKLTGGGGGGSMIALCRDGGEVVAASIKRAGYAARAVSLS